MKLRNKKTGEIIESACIGVFKHKSSGDCERVDTEARSLERFLEDWEDYEPLIKDEKFREAVRAWFGLLPRLEDRRILFENGALWVGVYQFDCGQYDILNTWLKSGEYYTITELCGEEE